MIDLLRLEIRRYSCFKHLLELKKKQRRFLRKKYDDIKHLKGHKYDKQYFENYMKKCTVTINKTKDKIKIIERSHCFGEYFDQPELL